MTDWTDGESDMVRAELSVDAAPGEKRGRSGALLAGVALLGALGVAGITQLGDGETPDALVTATDVDRPTTTATSRDDSTVTNNESPVTTARRPADPTPTTTDPLLVVPETTIAPSTLLTTTVAPSTAPPITQPASTAPPTTATAANTPTSQASTASQPATPSSGGTVGTVGVGAIPADGDAELEVASRGGGSGSADCAGPVQNVSAVHLVALATATAADGTSVSAQLGDGGLAVPGGRSDAHIDYDAGAGTSEQLALDFGQTWCRVSIGLRDFAADEWNNEAEAAHWIGSDASGVVVQEGWLLASDAEEADGVRLFDLDVDASLGITAFTFEAAPYGTTEAGTPVGATDVADDNSDFALALLVLQ